jgi:transposase
MDAGLSQNKVASLYNVDKRTVAYWRSKRHLWESCPSKKKSTHKGAKVKVPAVKVERLLNMLEEKVNQMQPLNVKLLTSEMMSEISEFLVREGEDPLSKEAWARQRSWVRRFLERTGYSIRRPTHIAQNANGNLQAASDFIDHINSTIALYQVRVVVLSIASK